MPSQQQALDVSCKPLKTLLIISGLIWTVFSCTDTQQVTVPKKLFDVSYQLLSRDTTFSYKYLQTTHLHEQPDFYGTLFLEDSLYQIYGCCAGEFGGSLFFYNKTNKKLFFYPSGCVDQVVQYHGSYYVFENLYNANYLRINYPQELIELQYKNRRFGCNWWVEVDSLKKYYTGNVNAMFPGLTEYKNIGKEHSLSSFVFNDTLFTIVSTDSSTYLAMHQSDSLLRVQKLLDKQLWFHHTDYYKKKDTIIVFFSASSTQWNADTKAAIDKTNSGFIAVHGRNIKIAEHPTSKNYIKN